MVNPGRGLPEAVTAMIPLPHNDLLIVGDGPELQRIIDHADHVGVASRTHFTGLQPPDRLPAYTDSAWLGLNLLEADSPSYYYSLANKSLDYLQAGLPSIQMDFPEYRRINERYDCFLLLPRLDARLLADTIESLRRDPERYTRLRQNCLRAAKDLCWEREAPRLLAIYEKLA
jgi:glycosyltransferase involved in cell wall biosynthesis